MSDLPQEAMADSIGGTVVEVVSNLFSASGMMLTGMIGIVTFINTEGERCWAIAAGQESQGPEVTAGLVRVLDNYADMVIEATFPVRASE